MLEHSASTHKAMRLMSTTLKKRIKGRVKGRGEKMGGREGRKEGGRKGGKKQGRIEKNKLSLFLFGDTNNL